MAHSMKNNDHRTIAAIRALRAEQARAAAYYAHRAQEARAASRHIEAARWTNNYRHAVASCRRLGEMIHGGTAAVEESGPVDPRSAVAPTVLRRASLGPEGDIPTTGAAA
jgi:hypothetical protein